MVLTANIAVAKDSEIDSQVQLLSIEIGSLYDVVNMLGERLGPIRTPPVDVVESKPVPVERDPSSPLGCQLSELRGRIIHLEDIVRDVLRSLAV